MAAAVAVLLAGLVLELAASMLMSGRTAVTAVVGAVVVLAIPLVGCAVLLRRMLAAGYLSAGGLRAIRQDLGLQVPTRHRTRWLVAVPLALVIVSVVASSLANVVLGSAGRSPAVPDSRAALVTSAGLLRSLLALWLAAGVAEELAFRGFLLLLPVNRWGVARRRRAVAVAILVLSSVAFGAWHWSYGTSNVVSATVDGVTWGLTALWSRSLLPGVLAHGLYDSLWAVVVTSVS